MYIFSGSAIEVLDDFTIVAVHSPVSDDSSVGNGEYGLTDIRFCTSLGEYEDLKEFNLTEIEVKRLAMYGHLSKQIDGKEVNIELHIMDKITKTFSDYIEKIVERCLGRYEYVVEFTINGDDILTHYDELTLNECGKIIMDFATSNVIDEISITFPPNLEND